ncbi:SAV_2336 N-terminal domain-related protein [Streptomyces sp. NPDC059255]|uniref:SAV_2336 N-terminal domain-related protein n=1 Tax=Streptomyces sp. NPDC059255 TaxID=3346793 RepID=UPI00368B3BB2
MPPDDETFPGLGALREVLAAASGEPPTGRELAELLWLAARMRPAPTPPGASRTPPGPNVGTAEDEWSQDDMAVDVPSVKLPRIHRPSARDTSGAPAARPAPPVVLRTTPASSADVPPEERESAKPSGVLAPAPPMISRPLALQRALRPLRRTVPSTSERELDEAGTVYRIASLGARRDQWLPELRPARERWLHLRLVVDEGPTMALWQPLARDLFTAFGQTGAFRTVELVRLAADGTVPPRQWTAGRTLALVISDAMGPQWREGPAGRRWYDTLRGWARRLPVAVLQPLPERMWQQTALAPVPGLFTAPGPGAPNTALRFAPYDGPARGIPVPVVEPAAEWLTHWAGLVASSGGASFPGAAALLPAGRARTLPETWRSSADGADTLVPEDVPADELVLRFRAAASPQAVRLAGHLAVGPAHLPVMRLVQAAVEEHPRPQHLAEVVLSGMLRSVPGPPGSYDFRPGVREALLHSLPRTSLARTVGLLDRVGAEIESRAGSARGEFRALLGGGADGEPFALVSPESIRLLRGPEPREPEPVASEPVVMVPERKVVAGRYELLEVIGRGERSVVWRAYDRTGNRLVAVKWVHGPGPEIDAVATRAPARFHREMRGVTGLRHPHIITIHDFGTTDDSSSYVVMELVTGRSLDAPVSPERPPLSVAEIITIARQVLAALLYAHDQGVWHRHLAPANIILRTDGIVKVGGFGLTHAGLDSTRTSQVARGSTATGVPRYMSPEQIAGGEVDQLSDLYSLGCILYELVTGEPPFAHTDIWLTLTAHRDERPRPPQLSRPGLPAALGNAILDLLAKDPQERRRGADSLASTVLPVPTWQYQVLGPLRAVKEEGQDRTPSTPAGRIVLSKLLLSNGAWVSVHDLWHTLSDEPSPQTDVLVIEALHELVAGGHPVEGEDGYCRLAVGQDQVDLYRARQLATEAARERDPARSAVLYRTALALWRGEPLGGIDGEWAASERQAIRKLRSVLETHQPDARDAAHRPPSAPGDAVHLDMVMSDVPPDNRSARSLLLSVVRQVCREVFGSPGTLMNYETRSPTPTIPLSVTPDPASTVSEVLDRLSGPFADTLNARLSTLVLPRPPWMTVTVGAATAAGAPRQRFPDPAELNGPKPGQIRITVLMSDELVRRIGAPKGFLRVNMKRIVGGVAPPIWFLTVSHPPEQPHTRSSWLRRMVAGGGRDESPAAEPPPEEPR